MDIKLYTTNEVDNIKTSIPPSYLSFFMSNPFLYEEAPFLLRAEDDGKMLGSVYSFPLEIATRSGEIYSVCAGSNLTVEPESRGMGLAKKMTLRRIELTKDKIAIASGLSGMSLPLFKKLGFATFMQRRNILLKNSRPVVEMVFKGGFLLKLFTAIANIFVAIQVRILRFECERAMKGFKVEEVNYVPAEVPDIVAQDPALYRENHTRVWFEWVLKGGFVNDDRSMQHLFVVRKNGVVVGFYMTKERFHKQASSRGFKNIILGSVTEWGVKEGCDLKVEKLLLSAMLSFGRHVDAVELCSADDIINKYFKKRFLIPVGESNFAVKAHEGSPLAKQPEYMKQCNWRIRPAASDNSFD